MISKEHIIDNLRKTKIPSTVLTIKSTKETKEQLIKALMKGKSVEKNAANRQY